MTIYIGVGIPAFPSLAQQPAAVLAQAGVDPNHQTDHCDHCQHMFSGSDEVIQTMSVDRYLTLCRDCYDDAGTSVR